MQQGDRKAFKTLITDALAFYRRDVSGFTLSVWWAACEPFELEQVAKALTAHATDPERGQFAPMPADIVKHLRGTFTDRSLVAWGKVLTAIRHAGAYRSVAFDDGAIHAAIEDLGGWVVICTGQEDDLPHLERRFMVAYKTEHKRDSTYPPYLIGIAEADNRLAGRAVAAPMLIGDVDAARLVMQRGVAGPRVAVTALPVAEALKALPA